VAQLLSYMGDLAVDGKAVRGILVAEDFDWGARSVARVAVAALDLKRWLQVRLSSGKVGFTPTTQSNRPMNQNAVQPS
jgi:hypothetical protein